MHGKTITQPDGTEYFIHNNPKAIIDHCNLVRSEEGRTKKAEIDLMSTYMVTLKRKYKIS